MHRRKNKEKISNEQRKERNITYQKAILPIALFMFWIIESIYAKRSNGT